MSKYDWFRIIHYAHINRYWAEFEILTREFRFLPKQEIFTHISINQLVQLLSICNYIIAHMAILPKTTAVTAGYPINFATMSSQITPYLNQATSVANTAIKTSRALLDKYPPVKVTNPFLFILNSVHLTFIVSGVRLLFGWRLCRTFGRIWWFRCHFSRWCSCRCR